ncbi:hypothetical protein EAG_03612 [Camponotus floridanus]|uniref:Uncharacterized protein n=1 Tax=Camponotus floridanus TaxID=104421 RepID=E2AP10_CAMFO|nr:hypothetical protein EAG_03612 [Camponotus floridanus]
MTQFTDDELAMIAIILDEEEANEKTQKRKWVHKAWKKRESEGEYVTLYKELIEDGRKFFEYFRMSENSFNIIFHFHLNPQFGPSNLLSIKYSINKFTDCRNVSVKKQKYRYIL